MDPYNKPGNYVQNDPTRSVMSLLGDALKMMKSPAGKGKDKQRARTRVHVVLTLMKVKDVVSDNVQRLCLLWSHQ